MAQLMHTQETATTPTRSLSLSHTPDTQGGTANPAERAGFCAEGLMSSRSDEVSLNSGLRVSSVAIMLREGRRGRDK